MTTTCHIGIDVSRDRLDIAVHETGETFVSRNVPKAIVDLAERLRSRSPALIVLEASGGYEEEALFVLLAAGLPVARVNPRQTHNFAKATGYLAKTDTLDARVLAHFACAVRPALSAAPTAEQIALRELVERRQALVEMRVAERNRLRQTRTATTRTHIERHIAWLTAQLDDIDNELRGLIGQSPAWRELDDIIESMPGVGTVAAVPCWRGCRSLGVSIAAKSLHSSGSPPITMTAASTVDPGVLPGAVPPSAACFICVPWPGCGAIRH